MKSLAKVGIFYHCDPAGHVPSGIDTFIRGILQWAPDDIEYTLYGATSDPRARPVGERIEFDLGARRAQYIPLISVDPTGGRSLIPLTVQYTQALGRVIRKGVLRNLDVLDFHRIEPLYAFRGDRRPKNVVMHQDMSVLRDRSSDIKWRHAPWLYEWIEQRAFSFVDRVFSVRESAVDRYVALYPAISDRFSFIPTWVDTSVFNLLPDLEEARRARSEWRQEARIPDDAELMVFVGRLDRQKNPLLLLEAFSQALQERPGLHLAVVGDGALRNKVSEVAETGLLRGKVTLLGAMDRFQIVRVLRASDLFVMSSAYEGMPIAVLEALATGLPVASTDVGELRRVVSDGVNGYLAASNDKAALSHAMVSALMRISELKGLPCARAVTPYHPERVLSRIYENHRNQVDRKQLAVG